MYTNTQWLRAGDSPENRVTVTVENTGTIPVMRFKQTEPANQGAMMEVTVHLTNMTNEQLVELMRSIHDSIDELHGLIDANPPKEN